MELRSLDNYKMSFDFYRNDMSNHYIDLVEYYLNHIQETSNVSQHIVYKGVDVITNIFITLLVHSKNLSLTLYHCRASIFYFVEYMNQIDKKDEKFLLVNLTLKDAIIYLYRKSIYEIPSEVMKRTFASNDKHLYKTIHSFVRCFHSVLSHFIMKREYVDMVIEEKKNVISSINDIFHNIMKEQFINEMECTILEKEKLYDVIYTKILSNFQSKKDLLNKYNIEESIAEVKSLINEVRLSISMNMNLLL